MRADPPRHIRDIAHLYISRGRRPNGGCVRLAVTGMSADVIPGFHVANLALAAAARGATVNVEERSGLPVNAGCFLGLDPRCWVPSRDVAIHRLTAFPRVSFLLGRENRARLPPDACSAATIEIAHLPPWNSGAEHVHEISRVAEIGPTIVLYLAESDAGLRPWRESDGITVRRVAFVTRDARRGTEEGCVGVVTRWKRALTDPLPVILRDPESHLARAYAGLVVNLLTVATSCVVPTAAHSDADSTLESR